MLENDLGGKPEENMVIHDKAGDVQCNTEQLLPSQAP